MVGLFGQFAAALGTPVDTGNLYGTLFRAAIADDVDANCGGLINYPFRSGEFLAGLPEGRPLFVRGPEARMSLGNFMRAQLFSAFSPVKIGMDVMTKNEGVAVDSLVGHGGIFTTPKGRPEDSCGRIQHPDQGHVYGCRRRRMGHGSARRLSVARRSAAR